jgi:hypothetical protein
MKSSAAPAEGVGPIEEQHVQVNIQVQRRAEALDQRDRPGSGTRGDLQARLLHPSGPPGVLTCALPGLTTGSNKRMLEREDVSDLVLDLEQRIDELQHMGDAELGTFGWIDWLILILIAIVLPVIAIVAAR